MREAGPGPSYSGCAVILNPGPDRQRTADVPPDEAQHIEADPGGLPEPTAERSENPSSIPFAAPGQLDESFQREAPQKVPMIFALCIKAL